MKSAVAARPAPAEAQAAFLTAQLHQTQAAAAQLPRFPRVWLNDARFDPTCDYFIKGLFHRRRLIVVYGPSGEGKTFWIIDACCHVATALSYRDRRVRQALVVYIAAEAGASIDRRFCAWAERHLTDERPHVPLVILTRGANLLNAVEVEALLLELRGIATDAGLPIGLVVFDTLSRSMPGGDEGAQDMTYVIGAADRIRDELDGASTVFVHHSGKDAAKGARGHSSLHSAADTVISVADRVVTIEKSRDGATGASMPFDLEVVELGVDGDGDTITTCIVVPGEEGSANAAAARPQKLTADERIALDALREEVGHTGQNLPATSTLPGRTQGVTVDAWRVRFYARLGDEREVTKQDTKRKAFDRGLKGLVAKRTVGIWEKFAWIW